MKRGALAAVLVIRRRRMLGLSITTATIRAPTVARTRSNTNDVGRRQRRRRFATRRGSHLGTDFGMTMSTGLARASVRISSTPMFFNQVVSAITPSTKSTAAMIARLAAEGGWGRRRDADRHPDRRAHRRRVDPDAHVLADRRLLRSRLRRRRDARPDRRQRRGRDRLRVHRRRRLSPDRPRHQREADVRDVAREHHVVVPGRLPRRVDHRRAVHRDPAGRSLHERRRRRLPDRAAAVHRRRGRGRPHRSRDPLHPAEQPHRVRLRAPRDARHRHQRLERCAAVRLAPAPARRLSDRDAAEPRRAGRRARDADLRHVPRRRRQHRADRAERQAHHREVERAARRTRSRGAQDHRLRGDRSRRDDLGRRRLHRAERRDARHCETSVSDVGPRAQIRPY